MFGSKALAKQHLEDKPVLEMTAFQTDCPIMEYLFVFAQSHEEFRVPELLSVSELHGFTIGFDRYANVLDMAIKRPFMILMLDKEEHAHILAQRCILIKCVF